jgi:hypothetical protein
MIARVEIVRMAELLAALIGRYRIKDRNARGVNQTIGLR